MTTTTIKQTRIFREWEKRVGPDADEISKAHIQQLYNHIYPVAQGHVSTGRRSALTEVECRKIVRMIESRDTPLRVTETQADQGRTWLTRYSKRLGLPEHCWAVRIDHFTFAGVRVVDSNYWRTITTPIYDAHFVDGAVMRYSTGAWQSGATKLAWRWIKPPEGTT